MDGEDALGPTGGQRRPFTGPFEMDDEGRNASTGEEITGEEEEGGETTGEGRIEGTLTSDTMETTGR